MELNIVKPGNAAAGTVSVSEATFAREYNEALVHQVVTAYLPVAGRVLRRKRRDLKSLVVVRSLGVRRVLGERERAPSDLQFGDQAARLLQQSRRITATRSIRRCIARRCSLFCQSWLVPIV